MIGIGLGLAFANAFEWAAHKYVLHDLGKDRDSVFSFHFHEHHKNSRKNDFYDEDYERFPIGPHAQGKELAALVGVGAVFVPLIPVAPFFVGTIYYSAFNYYRVHKRSHMDPEWAKENVPWHYDHHMGPNQDANWCVTRPWMDNLMGTREPYLGTERYERDMARRAERLAKKAARG